MDTSAQVLAVRAMLAWDEWVVQREESISFEWRSIIRVERLTLDLERFSSIAPGLELIPVVWSRGGTYLTGTRVIDNGGGEVTVAPTEESIELLKFFFAALWRARHEREEHSGYQELLEFLNSSNLGNTLGIDLALLNDPVDSEFDAESFAAAATKSSDQWPLLLQKPAEHRRYMQVRVRTISRILDTTSENVGLIRTIGERMGWRSTEMVIDARSPLSKVVETTCHAPRRTGFVDARTEGVRLGASLPVQKSGEASSRIHFVRFAKNGNLPDRVEFKLVIARGYAALMFAIALVDALALSAVGCLMNNALDHVDATVSVLLVGPALVTAIASEPRTREAGPFVIRNARIALIVSAALVFFGALTLALASTRTCELMSVWSGIIAGAWFVAAMLFATLIASKRIVELPRHGSI